MYGLDAKEACTYRLPPSCSYVTSSNSVPVYFSNKRVGWASYEVKYYIINNSTLLQWLTYPTYFPVPQLHGDLAAFLGWLWLCRHGSRPIAYAACRDRACKSVAYAHAHVGVCCEITWRRLPFDIVSPFVHPSGADLKPDLLFRFTSSTVRYPVSLVVSRRIYKLLCEPSRKHYVSHLVDIL